MQTVFTGWRNMKRWSNWRPQWAYLAGLYLDYLDLSPRDYSGGLFAGIAFRERLLAGLDREDSRRAWDHGIPSALFWEGDE